MVNFSLDIYSMRAAESDDDTVLHSHSRAPKRPQLGLHVLVLTAIRTMRLHPPHNLGRIPGPKAILYYLRQDETLAGYALPRSTRTVYRVLKAAGCIESRPPRLHEALERPDPMTTWEFDFKENTFAMRDQDGKRQHMIEILVTIDTGTSRLLDLAVRDDYTAETALLAMAELVQRVGLPQVVRFDRDPRFVGNTQHGDVPSAFVRFWLCLGVQVVICDPHRPQDKGFVERVNRTLEEECLQRTQPRDLGQTREAMAAFLPHYNEERPNQAVRCQNQPPATAFPVLPELPPVPAQVDPDGWLAQIDGLRFTRMVGKDGRIRVDKQSYYVGCAYHRQRVGVRVDAAAQMLVIEAPGREIKRVALRGLRRSGPIPFADWVAHLQQEAVAEQRRQRAARGSGTGKRAAAGWLATLQEALAQVRAAAQPAQADPTSPEAQRQAEERGEIPF